MIAHSEAARASLVTLGEEFHVAAQLAMNATLDAATASAKGTTLFKDQSGETRGSIRSSDAASRTRVYGFVRAGGASKFLENGTKPASSARTVRMTINGATIFRRFVHPGIAARPFMHEAFIVGSRTLEYGLEIYANAAIQKHNA